MRRALLAIPVALLQAACLQGPRYARPDIPLPQQHRNDSSQLDAQGSPAIDLEWLDQYRDQKLRRLIEDALTNNYDVRIAAERVLEARAQFRIDRSFRFPTIDLTGDITQREISRSAAQLPASIPREQTAGGLSPGLSWELDFWGRLRRLSQTGRAEYLAQEWAQRNVRLSVVAEVASTYLSLLELDRELAISRRTLETRRESLRLTQARKNRGVATGLEVRQAENLVYSASATIPELERLVVQQENLIRFLVGGNPGEVDERSTLSDVLIAPAVPAGLPAALLERRPDIQAAEQRLVAANARIGAAKAALYPTFSLTGSFGFRSLELDEFLDGDARARSFSAGVIAPIFNAGRLRAGVRATEAQQRQSLVEYERTIRNALREVADSLIALEKLSEQLAEQEKLVTALSEANRLSRLRYEGGVDNYLQVLDAERNLFGGQLELARIQRDELLSRVELFRALGGGWRQ